MSWRSSPRLYLLSSSFPFLDTNDVIVLTTVSATVRAIVHGEDALWRVVSINGPYPFGFRPCVTAYAPHGRVLVPRILEMIVQRHGKVIEAIECRDLLVTDAVVACIAHNCRHLQRIDFSHSEHRLILNTPSVPTVLTSSGLSCIRVCVSLRELHLRHSRVWRCRGER